MASPARKHACFEAQQGFTLVELVVTIVVMGIMAFGTVSYITSSSQIYQQAATGDRLGTGARLVVDRLGREVRSALPNSVRVSVSSNSQCLEFVPVLAAGTYLTLAQGLDTSMTVLPLFEVPQLTVSSPRLSVYPVSSSGIYSGTTVSPELDLATTPLADLALSATNLATSAAPVSVSFTLAPNFPADSPQRRWFLVEEPVSFCVTAAGQLFRYQGDGTNYTYQIEQPNPPALGGASDGQWLVAQDLEKPSGDKCGGLGNDKVFRVEEPTLQRNAIVLIDLCMRDSQGGVLQLVHEVQLRNVP